MREAERGAWTTEAERVIAAQAGEAAALEALLLGVAPRVRRFAGSLCDDPADADEVAQEALLSAVVALPGLRDPAAFPAWIFALTRRQAGRLRRRARRRPEEPSEAAERVAGRGDPEGEASAGELGGAFTAALGRLPEGQRAVVVLRDVEGLSAQEVATALDIEVSTVKTRLHRGRAALRAELSPLLSPQPPALESADGRPAAACPDVVSRFSRYLEGDIDPQTCDTLHAHVEGCPACNAACASLRRSVSLCHRAGREGTLQPALQRRVREALQAVISGSENFSAPG
jgi:RNA polymerase sigma-70 factor (ECF subfamily)